MLNTQEVINTVNALISKNTSNGYCSIVVDGQIKPHYNNGVRQPNVCSLKLDVCTSFYQEMAKEDVCEKVCPFGFTVCKKTFNTSSNYNDISAFSIVDYHKQNDFEKYLTSLPRGLKGKRLIIVNELNELVINETIYRATKDYIEGLLETLLIGRIGLAIQSISHQFFTPLQGAMSDVRNVEKNRDRTDSIKRLVKNFNSLKQLATQIQLILSTSQEFNENMLRRVVVHNVVDDIYKSLESAANEKNIELKQGFNNTSKTVEAIPGQLEILLSNIIHNAIKYSFRGYGGKPLNVSVEYRKSDRFLIIKVVNEGTEITKKEISEGLLFNLSYRGIDSTDGERTGSGTGLYVCHEIIKAHGGRITVDSKFCGGSIENRTDRYRNQFEIYWPIIFESDPED